jgi:hypothetical protein
MRFSRFVILSLILVALALLAPTLFSLVAIPIARHFVNTADPIQRAFPLHGWYWSFVIYYVPIILWLALFVVGLFKYRSRGLWLLLETPLVFFWMTFLMACAASQACP